MANGDVAHVASMEGEPSEQLDLHGPTRVHRGRGIRGRATVIGVLTVLAAAAGIGIWLGTGSSSTPAVEVTTQVVTVTTGTMQRTVAASGTLEPAQQADVDFAVGGQVTAVDVTTGQTVTAGQTLATLDPSALQARVDAAQASLTAAEAKLSSDEAAGAVASQVDSDQAAVVSAQSALASAQTDLSDATLVSPIAGTVASVSLSVGQEVSGSSPGGSSAASGSGSSSASSGSSGSSAQVVVVSTGSYVVSTSVDDTEVGLVKPGEQAVITPTGSTAPVYGLVSSVGLIASNSSGVATFPVEITVTGSPAGLYAGATAEVSIVVQQIADAVEVPTAAVSYSPGGAATVPVVEGGRQGARPVTTGVSANGQTQITSGLTPGEKVLERVVSFNGVVASGGRSLFGGRGVARGGFLGGGLGGGARFGGGGLGGGGFGGGAGG